MAQELGRDEDLNRLRAAAAGDAILITSTAQADGGSGAPDLDHLAPAGGEASVPEPVVVYDAPAAFQPLRLRYPFTLNGQRIEALSFAEPSFLDVEDLQLGRISELELHARMASVDVAVLRALKWSDSETATTVARLIAPELRRR